MGIKKSFILQMLRMLCSEILALKVKASAIVNMR